MLLLYSKWRFLIHQWLDRIETFKTELTVHLDTDHVLRGMLMILSILVHDCIFKVFKIFYFSRYKPAGLNFTISQMLEPIIDILLVVVSMYQLIRAFLVIRKATKTHFEKLHHYRFSPLFVTFYPLLTKKREQQVMRYQRRKYADIVLEKKNNSFYGMLILLLVIIPLCYICYCYLFTPPWRFTSN